MLSGAVLYAKDLRRLVEFYSALGGKTVDGKEGEFTTLEAKGIKLIVLQIPEHIAAKIKIETPPTVRAETPLKPIILVSSIDSALDEIPAFGGSPLPGSARWEFDGHQIQDIFDPEGNVVQLWQPNA